MPTTTMNPDHRQTRAALLSVALGLLFLGALAAGGETGDGLKAFAVMAAVGAVFAFGGRSETVRDLGGHGRDERAALLDLRATAFAGVTVLLAALGAWLWEVSRGEDGEPFIQLAAIGGLAYVIALAFLRLRS